ncbi:MAG: ATPase [Alphaproteobacteria bacterium]|nr:ATPase [Alphaproteobacteria bacterium]
MALGEELVEAGLVTAEDVAGALQLQRRSGLPLGECLLEIGAITGERLDAHFNYAMPSLTRIEDTGLGRFFLLDLMLKIMFSYGLETKKAIAEEIKLPLGIVDKLMEIAYERRLVESLGATDQSALVAEIRYGLSDVGRTTAIRALELSSYAGPAPVTLEQFSAQVGRQRIVNDRVDGDRLRRALSRLTLAPGILEGLGPAVNSGRSMLFYGEPGNGKTSIAVAISQSFEQYVYVPYAISVGGQVINIYDPALHVPVGSNLEQREADARASLLKSAEDPRWLRCHRPIAIAGGELTLGMLDIIHNESTRYSEAPLQLKAVSGVFLIDDLGRQESRVEDILNRWVFPLERGIDFLTLPTGKKFSVPFGSLIIFSTNKPPSQLVDDAMLRRIPYKFYIGPPSLEEFETIFRSVCAEQGVEFSPALLEELLRDFYPRHNLRLARFHPAFIMRHVVASCRYYGRTPALGRDLLFEAAEHLVVND